MFRKWIGISILIITISCLVKFWMVQAAPAPTIAHPLNSSFKLALPGYEFSFPKDHGAHPDYRTEWWYYTGHLQAEDGSRFGYELTFFRFAMVDQQPPERSDWAVRDVDFAHFAITDETNQKYFFCDRMERANMNLAGTETGKAHFLPRIWIDNWQLQFQGKKGNQQLIEASGNAQNHANHTSMAIRLQHTAQKPPVINGKNGVSQKGPKTGQASHYYSMTRLSTTGSLRIGNRRYNVTGQSWLDREFSSKGLAEKQIGWDWFAIQLEDGRDLMLYQIRQKGNVVDVHSAGTLVDKNGNSTYLQRQDFQVHVTDWWTSPHTKARYPAGWKVVLPQHHIAVQITPTVADQEMRPRHESAIYWEGSCNVKGIGNSQRGKAYVELTGYLGNES